MCNTDGKRRWTLIAGVIAAALVVGGCVGSLGTRADSSSALDRKPVSADASSALRSAPNAQESAMLTVARRALPEYFTQRDLECSCWKDVKGIDPRSLSVRLPDPDPGERARPTRFDPAKPIFSQLATAPELWKRESLRVEVVTPTGMQVGEITLDRDDEKWSVGSGAWGDFDSQRRRRWAVDERRLTAQLGGSVDETAAVGLWLLARKGSREVGVVPGEGGAFTRSTPLPEPGRVYSGAELIEWFGSYGSFGFTE